MEEFSHGMGEEDGSIPSDSTSHTMKKIIILNLLILSLASNAVVITPDITKFSPIYVTVSWTKPIYNVDGSPLIYIKGYLVKFGDTEHNLFISGENSLNVKIPILISKKYYFNVQTINNLDIHSIDSATVSKIVP